ncbi:hypothetical protein HY478_01550 [Candidatus Uhrbacteria bacterium]|nr:hypothetical protein [Candidatus Uhrbacteria bacterium]
MNWILLWARARDTWQYRHEPEQLRILTDTYWRAILLVAFFVTLGVALYSGTKLYTFLLAEQDSVFPSRGGGASLNRSELQGVLEMFEARRERYEFLKKNPPKISDPSR